jgi:hypothetical protein
MRPFWLGTVLLILLLASAQPLSAAPAADPWPRWAKNDPTSAATVDHALWAAFLDRYVRRAPDGTTRLAYGEVTEADRAALDRYIAALSATPISFYAPDEQMAFWIDLYNAATVRLVLEHYPVASIRDIDIPPAPLGGGPWEARILTVEGQDLSLDDIEHRILRPLWKDPRVHYALNRAAIGCPDLQPAPFTGKMLDHQLDQAAMEFVNQPKGVRLDDGRLIVSSLYVWYRADFEGTDKSVLAHLMAYAAPPLAMKLQAHQTIDGDQYDWRLNDIARTN